MGRASLSELIGKAGGKSGKLSLEQLPEILGDAMPELPKNAIGKHRLVTALRNRFGHDFRNLPGVSGLISEFDESIALEHRHAQIRAIKLTPHDKGK
jgi:hypothetical protein